MGTERRRTWWGWAVAAAPAIGVLVASAGFGITYNSTPSIPVGLYRIQPLDAALVRGEIVGVCLEGEFARFALDRGYVRPRGLEHLIYGTWCASGLAVIGKPVAGLPGDSIDVGPDGVRVNGVLLRGGAAPSHDRRGRAVPRHPQGRFVLGPGEFWLQSTRHDALDSRLFGPASRRHLVDRRTPVALRPEVDRTHVRDRGQHTSGAILKFR